MRRKNQRRKLFAWSLLLLAFTVLAVSISEVAFARAGGGHGYSGGGGSGGGSGGGGGGGDLIILLIRLIIYYPHIGIPLTIVVIILAKKGYLKGEDKYVDYTIVKASHVKSDSYSKAALTQLKQRDPAFDENFFNGRAKKAFKLIQEAWTARKLDKAQAFMSDGIFEQFSIQLAEMREKGIIDHMEGLEILSATPVKFQSDRNFDVIHLRIDASAINYRKDDKTSKLIEGSRSAEAFAEVWSFMRKPGVKTLKKGGLMEGQCPNCGNPIQIGRLSKCDVCGSLLRSGEYDWVLTSITQACEWSARPDRAVPGLDDIVAADPGFNMQHIKERVSVMFWRKTEAERIGKIDPLRKIARNEFCEGQIQWFKPDKSGARRFYTGCAVGAINLLGVELLEPDDNTFVEVIWSGIPSFQMSDKKIQTAGQPINFKHVFVLSRKHGANTKLETALASSHCPSCGAPEQTGSANECAYCGSVMNDGKTEWVLDAVVDRSDAQVKAILDRLNTMSRKIVEEAQTQAAAKYGAKGGVAIPPPLDDFGISGLELMRWTVAMMLADGHIDSKEMSMIKDLAAKRDIHESRLQQLISEFKAVPDPVAHVMQTSKIAADTDLLRHIARVALADGKLTVEETDMLKTVGGKLGMSGMDIDMLLKRERKAIFQEAKDILRNLKT
ncbi:MAG: TIM44-like domain-containing protein [Candidatus Riflebacteria bacterium]|nr:TIM44-like domain-containing protein [Candidatus Riflebacteria bacterium]